MARSENASSERGHRHRRSAARAVWVPACRRGVPNQGGMWVRADGRRSAASRLTGSSPLWLWHHNTANMEELTALPGIVERRDKITTRHRNRPQTPNYAGLLNPKEKSLPRECVAEQWGAGRARNPTSVVRMGRPRIRGIVRGCRLRCVCRRPGRACSVISG